MLLRREAVPSLRSAWVGDLLVEAYASSGASDHDTEGDETSCRSTRSIRCRAQSQQPCGRPVAPVSRNSDSAPEGLHGQQRPALRGPLAAPGAERPRSRVAAETGETGAKAARERCEGCGFSRATPFEPPPAGPAGTLMKIDVEGGEWEALAAVSDEDLKKVDLLDRDPGSEGVGPRAIWGRVARSSRRGPLVLTSITVAVSNSSVG